MRDGRPSDDAQDAGETRHLRFLRRLVTVLTAVMILGVITIVALLVMRLQGARVVPVESVALPDGGIAPVVAAGRDLLVIETGGALALYDRARGVVLGTIAP